MPRTQPSTPLDFLSKAASTSGSDHVTEARSASSRRSSRSLDRGPLRPSLKEQPSKTTPKARLRHDDSQIQFAAIESSPLASEVPDSQILTDRQREVRERQNLEAGIMFPDLRSTSKPRVRERGGVSPKLILKGTQASSIELDLDESCPVLPPVDDILDDVFSSSPTPRSSRRNSDQRSLSIGPPSSPLGKAQVGAKPYDEPTLPYTRPGQCEVEIEGKKVNNDDFTSTIYTRASSEPPNIPYISDKTFQLPLDKSRGQSIEPETRNTPANGLDQEMTDINPPSDFDVFVDAPSDPLPTTESDVQGQRVELSTTSLQSKEISKTSDHPISHEIIQEPVTSYAPDNVLEGAKSNVNTSNEKEVSWITNSFEGSERSYFPSEDEQIAAQLVSDLERASSQAEAEMMGNASTITQPGKACKKRNISTERLGPIKKAKPLPKPQVFQVVIESRKPENADDDCIVVDGDNHSYLSGEELKEEHSPTPSRITRASTRKSNRSNYSTGRAKSSAPGDYHNRNPQASSEGSHFLPVIMEPQLESSPGVPASVELSLQRRPGLSDQSSIESSHAQNSPSAKHHEVDEAPPSTEISRCCCSGSGVEMMHKSSGITEVEMEPAVNRPLELHAPCREIARDMAMFGDQGAISPCQSVESHDLATHTYEGRTEIEKAGSPSRTIVLPSGGDHILSTSPGLDTSGAIQPKFLDATQQIGNWMQQEQEPTAQGILAEFKRLVGDIRQVMLNTEEEREIIGTLFECVREVHEAGRRSTDG